MCFKVHINQRWGMHICLFCAYVFLLVVYLKKNNSSCNLRMHLCFVVDRVELLHTVYTLFSNFVINWNDNYGFCVSLWFIRHALISALTYCRISCAGAQLILEAAGAKKKDVYELDDGAHVHLDKKKHMYRFHRFLN